MNLKLNIEILPQGLQLLNLALLMTAVSLKETQP